jgi:hypothetical protein
MRRGRRPSSVHRRRHDDFAMKCERESGAEKRREEELSDDEIKRVGRRLSSLISFFQLFSFALKTLTVSLSALSHPSSLYHKPLLT